MYLKEGEKKRREGEGGDELMNMYHRWQNNNIDMIIPEQFQVAFG